MAILMCRPDHYGVEYEINPWMHVGTEVDGGMALAQWSALHTAYTLLGEEVILVDQQPGLPDMVFTANAAVVHAGEAVLSRFRHPERQGEEPYWQRALERLGITVHRLPDEVAFEGAGDALFVGERLFCGHGFRTDLESHPLVSRLLDVEVVSLRLVDPRFYHLDTCFCPLNESTVLFAPAAFDAASQQLVRHIVPHVIEVPVEVAAGFACNAIRLGDRVISSLAAERLEEPLHHAGFDTVALPMSEFMKSGGGVRCLSLPVDLAELDPAA
ncbi:MAG TPA: arginine deiminase-related protein [Candidatus Dormibacteraeota bacterium]|jgi:N-dimethylarginine dimethylaminohydrolase|nr:arginine deiminase-related protein [Candidatus Dormibacteraeota bacterium]